MAIWMLEGMIGVILLMGFIVAVISIIIMIFMVFLV
jgi:hypothetical protein